MTNIPDHIRKKIEEEAEQSNNIPPATLQKWQEEAEKLYSRSPYSNNSVYEKMAARRSAYLKGRTDSWNEDRWVSVKIKRPKAGELVLISKETGNYRLAYTSDTGVWYDAVLGTCLFTEPTHWQPITLPTAPKSKI